jgi:hypothetical protein
MAVIPDANTDRENWRALRAYGCTLFNLAMWTYHQNQEQTKEAALSVIEEACKLATDVDDFDKFLLHGLLSELYCDMDQSEKSLDAINIALTAIESKLTPELMKEKRDIIIEGYLDKARYLNLIGKAEESLVAYNVARAKNGQEEPLQGYNLDNITLLLNNELDPKGSRLLEMLKSWTDKERNAWFEYMFSWGGDSSAVARISRAAKLNGDEGVKYVLDIWSEFQATISPTSRMAIDCQAELATFYSRVLGNEQKAKELNLAILKTKVPSDEEEAVQFRLSSVRMDLADLIFTEFRHSADPKHKVALISELKSIPTVGSNPDDYLRESHIGMVLANMLRIMGPAIEYQDHMEKVFEACMKGLSDTVSWNDSESLRLLSKVLGSLAGLERDALIADSAQFSVLDPDLVESISSDADNSSSVAGDEEQGEDGTQTAAEADKENTVENVSASADAPNGATDESTENPAVAEDTEHHPQPDETVEDTKTDTGAVNGTSSVEVEAENGNVDGAEAAKEAEPTSEEPADESEDPADDQDLGGGWGVGCDGDCGRSQSKWDEPYYMCLICPNTDLCTECYGKRMAQNRGESTESWKAVCGKEHVYIKGPIDGWKGIKNGIIRIGDESISVKDWLKDLQEVRWKKAWERYWLRQAGLRNIGIEAEPAKPAPEEQAHGDDEPKTNGAVEAEPVNSVSAKQAHGDDEPKTNGIVKVEEKQVSDVPVE